MGASQLACYGVLLRIPFRLLLVLFWKAQARPTQVLPSRRGLSAERLVVIVVLLVFSDASRCGACLLDVDTASTALSFQNVAELTIPGTRFPLSGKEGEFVAVLDSCNPTHFFHVRSSDYSHGSAVSVLSLPLISPPACRLMRRCISTWAEQENTCPLQRSHLWTCGRCLAAEGA